MKFDSVRLAVLSLLTQLGPTTAHAADSPMVSFRAVCFDPSERAAPAFYLHSAQAERKALEAEKSRISDTQKAIVRDGRYVDFYLSEHAKEGEVPAMSLTLPGGSSEDLLFLFAPGPSGYRASAVKLPPSDFKPGCTLLVNTGPSEVAVVQGGAKPVTVGSGASRFLKLPDGFKETMVPIQIYEKSGGAEQWQIVQSTRWAVDNRFRSYVFFYRSAATSRLMLHGLTERMDATSQSP